MICLLRPVSQATLYIICFPCIVVVTYVNVHIHSTCLTMTLSCLKSPLLCTLYTNLSHLTTNLFLYMLFCVFPVCYDVRLSHLDKDYLLTYLATSFCRGGKATEHAFSTISIAGNWKKDPLKNPVSAL